MSIHKPTGSVFLSDLQDNQCRIGIQGPPFEGKTWAALTWPNPVILSYDRKVTAHIERTDVPIVPFYDGEFLDKHLIRRDGLQAPPNRKDSLIKWLITEGPKLGHEQTLILDGLPGIESGYHVWFEFNRDTLAVSKKGEYNKFVEWDLKKKYFEEVFDGLRSLKCDIICLVWETKDRNDEGDFNGKIRNILTGQVGDRLAGNFTDWMAIHSISKPVTPEQADKIKKWGGVDDVTLKEWINSTPTNYQAIHLFQTQNDSLRSCGCSSLKGAPKYIIANYTSFNKYRSKISTSSNDAKVE